MERIITLSMLEAFGQYLTEDEKSKLTIEKYMRDVRTFVKYTEESSIDRTMILNYKSILEKEYAVTSANSMLAALNTFLKFAGWGDLCVKQFKVQKKVFCPEEKELSKVEYQRLIKAAESKSNIRLSLLIQTICGTGMRVSELQYITVEAVQKGEAIVTCKGKTRTIFIVSALRKKLLNYAKQQNIHSGMIFITKTGKALNRSNIWREMKALCEQASVPVEKVFPHNLRHLFARTFYNIEKDIVKLADVLGHSSINTTRIYTITTGAEHKKRLESMRLVI